MVSAARVEAVHEIKPFRCLSITLELLMADRLIAQAKIIGLQHGLTAEQVHSPLRLLNHNLCDGRTEVMLELRNIA